MPDDLRGMLGALKDISGIGALIIVLWGLKNRWWVIGWVYDDSLKAYMESIARLEKDRDWWREKFLVMADALERMSQR